jgi:hypothetical protein
LLTLAVLLAGSLLLLSLPWGTASPKTAQASGIPHYRIEVVNDTGQVVRICIEPNHPLAYSESPGFLAPGEAYPDTLAGGPFAERKIYALSPTGKLVASKRAFIDRSGILKVPAGVDGARIKVTTWLDRAD